LTQVRALQPFLDGLSLKEAAPPRSNLVPLHGVVHHPTPTDGHYYGIGTSFRQSIFDLPPVMLPLTELHFLRAAEASVRWPEVLVAGTLTSYAA
jgi:hypothetical protein